MLTSELFSFNNHKLFDYHKNFKSFAIIIAFSFFLSTIFLSGIAHALERQLVERQLVFDRSPDNRVTGYYLYWGESENFGTVVKLEGKENTSHFLEGLEVGTTYYFAARAYDAYDNESVLSDVLVYTVDDCTVQYFLNLGVGPPGSGTINKEPDLEFYSSDSEVSLVATAASGYEFSHWSGDLSGSENPASVIMNGDKSVTAHFEAIEAIVETVSTPSVPEGSTSGTTGFDYAYSTGGSLSNLGNPVEYRFDWGDGTYSQWTEPGNVSQAWSSAGIYLIKAQARSVSDTSVESDWSASLSVTISPELIPHTVDTTPSGLEIVVDGVSYTAPKTFEWEAGTSHTLSVPSPQSITADERYVFSSWSNGGSQTHTITAQSSPTTYTASFTVQYNLKTFGSSSGEGTVSPSGENWYNKGESVLITATAASGYEFSHWSGELNGSENPATVTMNGSKSVTAHFSYNEPSFMEMGEAVVNHQWQRINFTQTFTDPVVVAKPASLNDPDPAVVRIGNVNETGFDIRIQEWDYLNGIHDYETVSYLVIEKGSYVLPGGIMLEAGTFEADGSKFTLNPFVGEFNYVPVVIASVTSINEANAVTGRIRNVTSGGFEYLLQQQDRNSRGPRARSHGTERVSFIACEPFSGNLNGITIEVGTTGNQVGDNFYYLSYTETFERVPYFLADMQTANEMDTANVRYRNKTLSSVEIHISEERSQNAEVKHENENVGYFIISD